MKSCFIVNYWADTDEKVDMVINGIQQLKKTGRDIIYTSLYPIDKRISEITTYSIFHNKNELISTIDYIDTDIEMYNNISFDTNDFRFFSIPLNQKDVSFSVARQLIANLKVLKNLGYDYFHFFVGDCFIIDEELNIFDYIEKSCQLYNKKAYFDNLTHRFNGYGAIYFSSYIDFFLNYFSSSLNKKDFIQTYKGISFETILKRCFEHYSEDLLLGKNDLDSFGHSVLFKTSQLDIISTYNTGTHYHIIPNIDQSISYIFVISREDSNYTLYIDDSKYESYVFKNNWWLCTTDKKQFHLKILKNDVIDFNETITEHRLKRIYSYSFFDANKRNI